MANYLVTGVPGAGKTLYGVSQVMKPLEGSTVELEDGATLPRRLVVGGVRDLLVEHEYIDVPTFDQERGVLKLGGRTFEPDTEERKPGDPPHECEHRADNWWRWCQPGDFIVVDECQRLFRPMSAGRRAPLFITMLETHRHFGVDFLFITQHPQLVHTNVRNLVNVHRHVRRMFGGATTVVYEWDHCSNPDRFKAATKKPWRHKKAAFGLYKSAEVHTKQKHTVGASMWMLGGALLLTPYLLYRAWGVLNKGSEPPAPAATIAPAQPQAQPGQGEPQRQAPAPSGKSAWPVLNVGRPVQKREPYADRGMHLQGSYRIGDRTHVVVAVTVDGRATVALNDTQLAAMGYSVKLIGPCAAVLSFEGQERPVTCDMPAQIAPAQASPRRQEQNGPAQATTGSEPAAAPPRAA